METVGDHPNLVRESCCAGWANGKMTKPPATRSRTAVSRLVLEQGLLRPGPGRIFDASALDLFGPKPIARQTGLSLKLRPYFCLLTFRCFGEGVPIEVGSESSKCKTNLTLGRLTTPSPNRTCGFPAYGSPRNSRRKAFTGGCLFGLLAQLVSKQRDFHRQVHRHLCRILRSELSLKRFSLPCHLHVTLGPLRSTGIAPLHHYYEPL